MNELIKNRRKCEYIVDAFESVDYGAVIYHGDIAKLIEERPCTPKYYSVVGQANRILTERGRPIKSETGQGYKLVHPDEIAEIAIREYKRGGRAISKGRRLLDYAPVDLMSEDARQVYRGVNERANVVYASIHGAVRELKLLTRIHPMIDAVRK